MIRSGGKIIIRTFRRADRSRVRRIIRSSGNFTAGEVATALELMDQSLAQGEASGYLLVVLENSGKVEGYACYGPTPLTDGVYDLYWIAVDLPVQGRGFGGHLLHYVEEDLRRRDGRMLLIETSSQEKYGPTIRFYERSGYALAARIPNFYRIGDDKLIFLKELK